MYNGGRSNRQNDFDRFGLLLEDLLQQTLQAICRIYFTYKAKYNKFIVILSTSYSFPPLHLAVLGKMEFLSRPRSCVFVFDCFHSFFIHQQNVIQSTPICSSQFSFVVARWFFSFLLVLGWHISFGIVDSRTLHTYNHTNSHWQFYVFTFAKNTYTHSRNIQYRTDYIWRCFIPIASDGGFHSSLAQYHFSLRHSHKN